MESQIIQAEQLVGGMSISEALYGGPRGPGLNTLIYRLSDTVTNLGATVTDLSKSVTKIVVDVDGSDGIRVSIKDLKRQIEDLKDEVKAAKGIAWKCISVLVMIGIGTVIMDARIAYNVFFQGK